MHRTKPILRFRIADRDVLERVYPREIRKFIPDFGPPKSWTAIHWEVVALYLERLCQLLVRNRRRLLVRVRSKDKKKRQIIEDENALLEKDKKLLRSEYARDIARIRYKDNDAAKKWILDKWAAEKSSYKKNKSEFARVYSSRLRHELQFHVSAGTIATRWLKGL